MRIAIEMNEKFGKGYQVHSYGEAYYTEGEHIIEKECELYPLEDSRPYDLDDAIRIALAILGTHNYATGQHVKASDAINVSVDALVRNSKISTIIA